MMSDKYVKTAILETVNGRAISLRKGDSHILIIQSAELPNVYRVVEWPTNAPISQIAGFPPGPDFSLAEIRDFWAEPVRPVTKMPRPIVDWVSPRERIQCEDKAQSKSAIETLDDGLPA